MLYINLVLLSSSCEEEEVQQHRRRGRDGTPSVRSAFVESCPSAVAQSAGANVCPFEPLLPSASLPFQSFGFPSTSLVLVSILTLRFLPSSHSHSQPSGLYPESQFRAVSAPRQASLHRGKCHCITHSSAAKGRTDFASQDCSKEWIYRRAYLWRQSFFLKCKYQKMLTEGTFVILGEHLCPYS